MGSGCRRIGDLFLTHRVETAIVDAVEEVIATNQALTPNLDSGGSRN
jgi:hypothetical protein